MKGTTRIRFSIVALLLFAMLAGCGKEPEFTVVDAVPVDELIDQLPSPWNERTLKPKAEVNGYVYYSDLLNEDQSASPKGVDFKNLSDKESQEVLKSAEPWIAELEIALSMKEWQAPLPDRGVATMFPELASMKAIQRMLGYASKLALQRNNTDEAMRLLLLSDRFADRQLRAGGSLIHFLVGNALFAISTRTINEVVLTGKFSKRQIETLLSATNDPGLFEGIRTAFVDEVQSMAAYEIAKLEFPKAIDSSFWGPEPSENQSSIDIEIANWDRVLSEIFIGHPDPFDQLETVTVITEIFDILLSSMSEPFELESKSRAFYEKKTFGWIDIEIGSYLSIGDWDSNQVDEARKKIKSESNPFGQMMVQLISPEPQSMERVYFRAKTLTELTRCSLGLRLYEMKHNKLPDSLGALIEAGVLDTVPQDHFASKPLRFDRERRIIWSVGQDMVDDGGKGNLYSTYPDFVIPF